MSDPSCYLELFFCHFLTQRMKFLTSHYCVPRTLSSSRRFSISSNTCGKGARLANSFWIACWIIFFHVLIFLGANFFPPIYAFFLSGLGVLRLKLSVIGSDFPCERSNPSAPSKTVSNFFILTAICSRCDVNPCSFWSAFCKPLLQKLCVPFVYCYL